MEEKIVVTNPNNEKLVLDKHFLFLWKCEEKKTMGSHIELRFSRDDTVPCIDEIRKLENEFGEYHIGSMLPVLILPGISIALFTVFLVVFFVNKDHFDFLLYFLSLLLPGILCLLASMGLMTLRTLKINRIAKEKPLKEAEYQEKINKLIQPTDKN